MRLLGKRAVVTGAGRGVGRAIALRLAQEGADVAVADLNAGTAAEVAGEITALGRRAFAITADVGQVTGAQSLVAEAAAKLGGLDILVNNAGRAKAQLLTEITEADWDGIFSVNVRGLFFALQAAAKLMMAQGSGRIVNIASIAGRIPGPKQAHYNASKAAVISITKSAAIALAPHGILVNAICPGIVETAMWTEQLDGDYASIEGLDRGAAWRRRVEAIPIGRAEQPEDVAGAVAFLCSDDGSYVVGQAIHIDGGMFMP